MLNIRGMSIVKNFLTRVNRFGQGLTIEHQKSAEHSEANLLHAVVR
jgi:hypothetical protein